MTTPSQADQSTQHQRIGLRFFTIFFVDAFLGQFARHFVLVGAVTVMAAILLLHAGSAFGIPLLFFHEDHWSAALAGCAVSLLLNKILFTGFLLDTNRRVGCERKWIQPLSPQVRESELEQAGYYLVGGAVSLIAMLLIGVVIWSLSGLIGWLQHHDQLPVEPAAKAAANVVPRGAHLNFSMGFIAGGIVAYILWRSARVLLRRLEHKYVSPIFNLALGLTRIDTPTQKRLHILAAMFTVALAIIFGYNFLFLPDKLGTAGTALCTALGLVVAIYGWVAFRFTHPGVLVLFLVALLLLGGIPNYKARVGVLDPLYATGCRVELAKYSDKLDNKLLFANSEPTWTKSGQKQPLVIVCVSGGGIRAAVWAAAVMKQLESIRDFPYHVRIIAGASGGMVGMSYYVCSLNDPDRHTATGQYHDPNDDHVAQAVAADSLSRTTKQMIYRDSVKLMLPTSTSINRGQTLEDEWLGAWGLHGNSTFGELRKGENEGWRPSLILSPMLIEDGRRLLISNLDLAFMTENVVSFDGQFLSRSGYEFARLFPKAFSSFPVRTAARLNASFPYVTPAPVLPTIPRRRVADAGYYDNFGVSIAMSWLTEELRQPAKRQWLQSQVSGVVIVQIRDGISELDKRDAQIETSEGSPLTRGLEWLTTPISGMLAARDSVSRFRNDNQIVRMGQMFKEAQFKDDYFKVSTFEFGGEASLSWYLTTSEKETLLKSAADLNSTGHEMASLKQWWKPRTVD